MATKYGNPAVREMLSGSIKDNENILRNNYLMSGIQKTKLQDAINRDNGMLARLTPDPVTGEEHNQLSLQQEHLKAALVLGSSKLNIPAMPSKQDMWQAPAGAADRWTQWEKKWKNYTLNESGEITPAENGYGGVFQWKDNQRRLNPDSEMELRDVANIESIRPDNSSPSLIDLRSKTFSSPQISYDEYMTQHPNYVPTATAAKAGLYPGWTHTSEQGVVKVDEIKLHTFDSCQATIANGRKCHRKNVEPTKPYCCQKTHKAQFPDEEV